MQRRCCLGAPGEHLVEVETLSERLDEAGPQGVLTHPVHGRRELVGQRVHPLPDREQAGVEPT